MRIRGSNTWRRLLPVMLLVLAPFGSGPRAATITILNLDGAGEGFNDPTLVAPVGGNSGTTLGEQRLNVFQYVAGLWGGILQSAVEIRVEASFDALTCTSNSAVLGSAGPLEVQSDFAGAPVPNTWYHIALANKLAGADLSAGDDIRARFNSNLGLNGCLGGTTWYYGLDGNHGSNIDLVEVVLHELGHGLGFSTLADVSSGTLFMDGPDIFSRFLFDSTTQKHWNEMTNTERRMSAVNTGHLVWDGPSVTAHANSMLGPKPILIVDAPASIAGTYRCNVSSFGPPLTIPGLSRLVFQVDDGSAPVTDACSPLLNGAQLQGRIALLDRGTCTFASKVKAAQNAGAGAVIIVDNVTASSPPSPGGNDPSITIPSVGITLSDGNTLKSELANGLHATLKLDPAQHAGEDAAGHVLLYAPSTLQPGSSVSHWDVSATPNLLMEPAITPDLRQSIDLMRYLFQDIGWFPGNTGTGGGAPRITRLLGNVPNPFNPSTTIRFDLERESVVELDVYDLSGRIVKRLVQGAVAPGPQSVTWNGTDLSGHPVASGVYMYRLRTMGYEAARRMVLLK